MCPNHLYFFFSKNQCKHYSSGTKKKKKNINEKFSPITSNTLRFLK